MNPVVSEDADLVRVTNEGSVRTLALNRPAALNAFTVPLHMALMAALESAAADPGVRCVVLTGSGRAFCAGQDLADPSIAPGADGLGPVIEQWYRPLCLRIASMPVPVLAAVNGVAAGAGANIALGCDLVLAAESASFIQAFAKIGLMPDCGGTWLLPRLVGRSRALGLALLGDKLSATDAQRMGLIWQCVPDAEFAAHTHALAQRLAALPTRALVATRHAIDAAAQLDYASALSQEAQGQRALGAADDYREGVEAFRAKRAPRFADR